jgi:hypothetical protein
VRVLDQQDDALERGAHDVPAEITPLYTRTMPGGGYVKVELVVSDRGDVAHERVSGRVVIEPRNASPRRDDLAPLVVEEVEGEDENSVVAELFRIAQDNAALARRVLRQRSIRRAD